VGRANLPAAGFNLMRIRFAALFAMRWNIANQLFLGAAWKGGCGQDWPPHKKDYSLVQKVTKKDE
jgi:hypothetical protein